MKKSKSSYADQAKKIISRYKKRLGENLEKSDKFAEAALRVELAALAEKQEAAKQQQIEAQYQMPLTNGQQMPQEQMAYGGELFGDDNYLDAYHNPNYVKNGYGPINPMSNFGMYYPGNDMKVDNSNNTFPTKSGTVSYDNYQPTNTVPAIALGQLAPQKKQKGDSWFSSIPTESLVGTGAQLAGSIASAALLKKPKDVQLQRTRMPEYLPTNNDEAIKQANLAYMDSEAALRGASPSQYYAGMSQLASNRAHTAAGLAEQNANVNASGMNAYAMQKAQMEQQQNAQQMAGDEINVRNQMMYNNQIAGIPQELMGIVAGGMKDKLGYDQFDRNMQWAGTNNYQIIKDSNNNRVKAAVVRPGVYSYPDSTDPQRDKTKNYVYVIHGAKVNYNTFIKEMDKQNSKTQ